MTTKPQQANPAPLPDKLILNLEDAPDFVSEPPQYTAAEMIKICEAMLPYWNKIRFSPEAKLAAPESEEFILTN